MNVKENIYKNKLKTYLSLSKDTSQNKIKKLLSSYTNQPTKRNRLHAQRTFVNLITLTLKQTKTFTCKYKSIWSQWTWKKKKRKKLDSTIAKANIQVVPKWIIVCSLSFNTVHALCLRNVLFKFTRIILWLHKSDFKIILVTFEASIFNRFMPNLEDYKQNHLPSHLYTAEKVQAFFPANYNVLGTQYTSRWLHNTNGIYFCLNMQV